MNKSIWIVTAALGLAASAPSMAEAHPPYLQGVSDFVSAELDEPACALPGMTCGLCHRPLAGDPLADIGVDIGGIETTLRDRSFYDGLTGVGGWMHSGHMPGDSTHIDMNRMMLMDTALPNLLADGYDGDGDGVSDLEELALGYNPLLAYDEGDPAASQLCGSAGSFPEVGGSSGSSGGDGSTGGGGSTSAAGDTTGSPDPDTSGGAGGSTSTGTDMQDTGGSGGSEDSGAADGGGDEGGCGCRSAGDQQGLLGLLLALGLGASRRRRARSAR